MYVHNKIQSKISIYFLFVNAKMIRQIQNWHLHYNSYNDSRPNTVIMLPLFTLKTYLGNIIIALLSCADSKIKDNGTFTPKILALYLLRIEERSAFMYLRTRITLMRNRVHNHEITTM